MSAAAEKLPDATGHFGPYGGRYVPETLMHPLQELEEEYFRAQHDPEFQKELSYYLTEFVGRPTPLYFAERLTEFLGEPFGEIKRRGAADKFGEIITQLLLKFGIMLRAEVFFFQLLQRMHQRLRHITSAVGAEMAGRIGQFFCGCAHNSILTQRRKDAKDLFTAETQRRREIFGRERTQRNTK